MSATDWGTLAPAVSVKDRTPCLVLIDVQKKKKERSPRFCEFYIEPSWPEFLRYRMSKVTLHML